MGDITPFQPLKLFIGILFSEEELQPLIINELTTAFGQISLSSDVFPYTHSSYYTNEMGSTLKKMFVVIDHVIDPNILASIKIKTNEIEDKFQINSQRRVNLDPGVLSLHNILLLSTKNFYHRIPLQNGIYAELTLTYSGNRYHTLPWTYPDFKFSTYQNFFLAVRKEYHAQLLG